jgi:hypothetical protein
MNEGTYSFELMDDDDDDDDMDGSISHHWQASHFQ